MSQHSILVIEDDNAFREMLCGVLETAGFSVKTAANGREATKLLAKETFTLVLTDLLMPEKDGLEVLMDMHKKHADLPIIAMSGGGRVPKEELLRFARHLGARAILEKPFTETQLLSAITKQLGKRPQRAP
jgi:DNA-binding NtrC family response regulator